MPAIDKGIGEIRVSDSSGAHRVITWPATRRLSMSSTPSTRKHRRRQGRILRSRKDDLGNCWEEGYEQNGELRKCLGCDRGHPLAGCESASAGGTDAEDRSTPEEIRLDTVRSGEPLRRDAAPDQRSTPRPGLALLARCAGQHRYGTGLPRARRSRRCLSRSSLKPPTSCSPPCSSPQVAVYKGTGSIDDTANFVSAPH
jgi:hypothetical protein